MTREPIDLHAVNPAHFAIHDRLLNWALCVRERASSGAAAPMFRHYRPYKVAREPVSADLVDLADGAKLERAVSQLPEKHAHAVRWCYVFPWRSEMKVCRLLAVQRGGLHGLIEDARSMLKNRL